MERTLANLTPEATVPGFLWVCGFGSVPLGAWLFRTPNSLQRPLLFLIKHGSQEKTLM